MSLFTHTIDQPDGSKLTVKVNKSKCGKGIVVRYEKISAAGKLLDVSCSGSCGGGPTIYWSCPDGTDCNLDCTSGTPVPGCS